MDMKRLEIMFKSERVNNGFNVDKLTEREIKRLTYAPFKCKYHPDAELEHNRSMGELLCSVCRLVVQERMLDPSAEWRNFEGDEDDPSRVGAPGNVLLGDVNLATFIHRPKRRSNAVSEDRQSFRLMERSICSSDRTLLKAFKDVRTICERINLPENICGITEELYKKSYDKPNVRTRSHEAKVGACLYIACRQQRAPRTLKEISAACGVPRLILGRTYQLIKSNISPGENENKTLHTIDFLPRFCGVLGLPMNVRKLTERIAKHVEGLLAAIKSSPISLASAIIYLAAQRKNVECDMKAISQVTGSTLQTIRNVYRNLKTQVAEEWFESSDEE